MRRDLQDQIGLCELDRWENEGGSYRQEHLFPASDRKEKVSERSKKLLHVSRASTSNPSVKRGKGKTLTALAR